MPPTTMKTFPVVRASKVWPVPDRGQSVRGGRKHNTSAENQGIAPVLALKFQIDEVLSKCRSDIDYCLMDFAKRYNDKLTDKSRTPPPLPQPIMLPGTPSPEMFHPSGEAKTLQISDLNEPSPKVQSPQNRSRSANKDNQKQWAVETIDVIDHATSHHTADVHLADPEATDHYRDMLKRTEAAAHSHPVGHSHPLGPEEEELHRNRTEAKAVFTNLDDLKTQMRANILSSAETFDISMLYYETGIMRTIALHPWFEYATLFLIIVNAIWMGYDTDMNTAATLVQANVEFIVMENFFCLYFFAEWMIRFLAFKKKCLCYKDRWFIFDSWLVFSMVIETWVLSLVLLVTQTQLEGTKALRWFRLARLTRLARMARLLRALPELLIMVKAIIISMKTVIYAIILLFVMCYVFSIAFTQLMEGNTKPEGSVAYDNFRSVPVSMNTLLLQGALPDQAGLIDMVQAESPFFYLMMLAFLFFGSLTVMNMLIGILCDVISAVSEAEREGILVTNVKQDLVALMKSANLGDENQALSRAHYEKLLLLPKAATVFGNLGVDIFGMADFADFIFASPDETVSFGDFMDQVLELRGSNTATVKDIIELRKLVTKEIFEQSKMVERLVIGQRQLLESGKRFLPEGTQQTQRIEGLT